MEPGAERIEMSNRVGGLSPHSQLGRAARIAVNHPLTMFFTLAYVCSWLVFLPMILLRAPIELTILASFGPTLAALITHRLATGYYGAFRLYTTLSRTLIATASGTLLIILAYVVLPGVATADPHRLNWSIIISVTVYNYSTLLGGPLGEEPGWRGYALPRLEAQVGPLWASVLLALLWAGWHLPLFLIPGWTSSPKWIYVLILIGLCVIMTFGANIARFDVIPAIVMHATFNTVSKFLAGLFTAVQPSTYIPFELVLALSGLGVAFLLVLVTKGRLAYERVTA